MTDRDDMMRMLRDKSIRDTEMAASHGRFALFSQPVSLAVGDDTYDLKKIPGRNENNKPITMPRNPCASAVRIGKDPSTYFNKTSYVSIGDLYIDPDRRNRIDQLKEKEKVKNETVFKPGGGYKTLSTSTYKHLTDLNELQKVFLDENGRVITHPPNPLAGIKDLQTKIYRFPEFMADPYERKRELEIKERMAHHAKLGEKAPFKSTHFGNKAFVCDKFSYGLDQPMPNKKPFKETQYNVFKHEGPFRPSQPAKKGYNGYLQPFPKYMSDPIRVVKKIEKVEGARETFRPSHAGNKTRPTPTITCNKINIRREMATFSHRI